ncbi:MAG: methyltransferase domain-containing protein [Pyrinomonadaceae bacterium]|nr:methyltransferase domain-containing protein [Pyrinomonadaceae bacterium]
MESYFSVNQDLWNCWTKLHINSNFYNIESFRFGIDTLDPITKSTLCNVSGKSLLHLQCHLGLDTLSFARQGANVTGVDFSTESINFAQELAKELDIPATFIQSNLYDLPENLKANFDVIFTSNGVLNWLPNLEKWAEIVSHFLKPNGIFYIQDIHPFALLFNKEVSIDSLELSELYFRSIAPTYKIEQGSYALRSAPVESRSYQWFHRLDSIINSILKSGLRLISFEEYPFLTWQRYSFLEKRSDSMWGFPSNHEFFPLMFTIQANKN